MNDNFPPLLSVVVPTFNESKSGIFPSVLEPFIGLENIELIVCDGGSEDATLELAQGAGARVIKGDFPSRAQRINEGIKACRGDMVLINHPRSRVELLGLAYLIANREKLKWGGFTHAFDYKHILLRFTSWYSNRARARLRNIVYLDHCKFARKEYLDEALPLPHVEIFEDTILSQKLFKIAGKPEILPFKSLTSALRFRRNGVLRQALINQLLKLRFHLGADHKKMNKLYERDLNCNGPKNKD